MRLGTATCRAGEVGRGVHLPLMAGCEGCREQRDAAFAWCFLCLWRLALALALAFRTQPLHTQKGTHSNPHLTRRHVWKQLVSLRLDPTDLRDFDEAEFNSIERLRHIDVADGVDAEQFEQIFFNTFEAELSDGSRARHATHPRGAMSAPPLLPPPQH